MIKILWTKFFYRFYFTIWIAVFSAIGSDGINSFYWAMAVGLLIDLIRLRYVPTELLGDGKWKTMKFSKISDLWDIRDNMIFSMPFLFIVYIWIICILDMIVPSNILDVYFGLFEPLYSVFGSQFEFFRDQARDLKLNGYESKALLAQHIYVAGLLSIFVGPIWYVCFRAHFLTPSWEADNDRKLPDPMTEVWKTFWIIIFVAVFWVGWNLLEVEYTTTHRRSMNVHEGYTWFVIYFPALIISTHGFLCLDFMMLSTAQDKINCLE